jgi:putative transposase
MTRSLEISLDQFYHIYDRGVDKRKVFMDEGDYERFVKLLYTANSDTSVHLSNYQGQTLINIPKGKPIVSIGAWCLMPNHFHLLVKEISPDGLSLFMQKLLTGYSMYFNTKYYRRGALFEGRFKAKHLDYDQYLKYQYTYIHLNPIGIIDSGWKKKEINNKIKAKKFLEEYKYSSYKDYTREGREEECILNKESFPEYFSTVDDFETMIEEWVNFDSEEISRSDLDNNI